VTGQPRLAHPLAQRRVAQHPVDARGLNAVATRLTIGGTIFLICSLVTGFFGQNFGWLVRSIDTKADFLIFGVGALVIPTVALLTLFWFKRDDWF
jgi:magnesium transporter